MSSVLHPQPVPEEAAEERRGPLLRRRRAHLLPERLGEPGAPRLALALRQQRVDEARGRAREQRVLGEDEREVLAAEQAPAARAQQAVVPEGMRGRAARAAPPALPRVKQGPPRGLGFAAPGHWSGPGWARVLPAAVPRTGWTGPDRRRVGSWRRYPESRRCCTDLPMCARQLSWQPRGPLSTGTEVQPVTGRGRLSWTACQDMRPGEPWPPPLTQCAGGMLFLGAIRSVGAEDHALSRPSRRRPTVGDDDVGLPAATSHPGVRPGWGGLRVAFEVAQALEAPLDVWIARGVESSEEGARAVGAVAEGQGLYLDVEGIRSAVAPAAELSRWMDAQAGEVALAAQQLRGGHPRLETAGCTALLVVDGIAAETGPVFAALRGLRRQGPRRLVLAAPVASAEELERLRPEVDEVMCLPAHLVAGSRWRTRMTTSARCRRWRRARCWSGPGGSPRRAPGLARKARVTGCSGGMGQSPMTSSETRFVWLDLEMTGLDPETCAIIEIGVIITGPDLRPHRGDGARRLAARGSAGADGAGGEGDAHEERAAGERARLAHLAAHRRAGRDGAGGRSLRAWARASSAATPSTRIAASSSSTCPCWSATCTTAWWT